ncbi:flagellar assembly protein FliW [Clostridium perfringens]|uniref:flagellar assembly protein FliW n=1 Tax=Brevibacillus agri TaxID=51101 RepID=UPI000470E59E|nr:flagellar assembly protein FliW [Brevibacillus agri]MCG5250141.1 flagellar assembly protein FliW [Brevibacillus agri]MDT7985592.1 flagellar assembly protein FliW [Clostridium perfringens]
MTQSQAIQSMELSFPDGVPGFPQLSRFQMTQEEAGQPFFSLKSLEDDQVGFWMIDPFPFFPQYEFTLAEAVKKQLQIEEGTPLSVRTVITVRNEGDVTVNLKAPIIINEEKALAKQVILNDENYDIRQPLFQRPRAVSE